MIKNVDNIIIKTVCRILTPFLQIFAFYVIAHGHYSPGGGFQGGCILGASFILLVIAYDINTVKKRMSEKLNTFLCSIGVMIYAGIGLLCLILGVMSVMVSIFLNIASGGKHEEGAPE
jgi:multicomponent Na+:H+ antiporter subunit B